MPDQLRHRRVLSLDWWLRAADGRMIVAQWPNPALWVWLVATLLRVAGLMEEHEQLLAGVGRGALIVWGLDELLRGVNPFRRLLGAGVLAMQLARFA